MSAKNANIPLRNMKIFSKYLSISVNYEGESRRKKGGGRGGVREKGGRREEG